MEENNKIMENIIKQVSASMGMEGEGMTLSNLEKEHLKFIAEAQRKQDFDLAEIAKNLKPGESFIEKVYEEILRFEEKRKTK